MDAIYIVLISVAGALLLFFLIYLYLIKPTLKRRKLALEYAEWVYAHRGLHSDTVAENSLTAFKLAAEKSYAIELDVRLSKDGELVVFHDDTLDRVVGIEGRVDSFTYDELKNMKLSGTEDTIPLFEDVLRIVDGRVPLLIELKEDAGKYGVTEKTVEVLKGYKGKYIIESFNPLALGRVKKLDPTVLRGILSMNYMAEEKYRKPMYFVLQLFITNVVCRPDFIAYDHKQYKNKAFVLCRKIFRVPTFAWTVRTSEEEKTARAHKFNSVIFENYLSGEKSDEI